VFVVRTSGQRIWNAKRNEYLRDEKSRREKWCVSELNCALRECVEEPQMRFVYHEQKNGSTVERCSMSQFRSW
jgi:hypothetical protein